MSDAKTRIFVLLSQHVPHPDGMEDCFDWLRAAEVPTPEARALLNAVATSGDSLMDAVKAYRDSLTPKPLALPEGWDYTPDKKPICAYGDACNVYEGFQFEIYTAAGDWTSTTYKTLPEAIAAAEKMLALLSPTGAK